MPSPTCMHRFWIWLNKNWPDDVKVNEKIFSYVNRFVSPYHLDGRPKRNRLNIYSKKRISLLELYEAKHNKKPRLLEEPEIDIIVPDDKIAEAMAIREINREKIERYKQALLGKSNKKEEEKKNEPNNPDN